LLILIGYILPTCRFGKIEAQNQEKVATKNLYQTIRRTLKVCSFFMKNCIPLTETHAQNGG
jgi:hypothetical protein